MTTISSIMPVGIVILLFIVPASLYTPMVWTRTGSFNITDTGTAIVSIEGTEGHIVVIHFSASWSG